MSNEDKIEYAWVSPDPDTGEMRVTRTTWIGRLRVEPLEVEPAEVLDYRADWRANGREGEIIGKLYIAAKVLAPEVKLGSDGRPEARPVHNAPTPPVQPWQALVEHMRVERERVVRYWTVQDLPVDEVRGDLIHSLNAALSQRIAERHLLSDNADDIRAAGREIMGRLRSASTGAELYDIVIDLPAA